MEESIIGKTIDGRYEIKDILGRGGMAVVYRAYQPNMDREVAIKMILPEQAGEEFIERFEREVRVVANLEHPHILPVYDFGTYEGQFYLVMRKLDAGDLKDRLRQGALSLEETRKFITQLASALTYAHEAGIVHRDLKPQNVLIDNIGNPYLTDFGIAKNTQATSEMTATGTIMGTPSYMAPEQWRSQPVDARTDIYALGIITYNMLTGGLPFESDTPFSLMYKHLDEMPAPLQLPDNSLSPKLTSVVFRAIAKDPAERYQSAVAFAAALDAAISNPTGEAGAVSDEFQTFLDTVGQGEYATMADGTFDTFSADQDGMATFVGKAGGEATAATMQMGDEPTMSTQQAAIPSVRGATQTTAPSAARPPIPVIVGAVILIALAAIGAFVILSGGGSNEDDGNIPALEDGEGRVIVANADVYEEPNDDADTVDSLVEGDEVDILGRTEDSEYLYVETPRRRLGYISADSLETVDALSEIAQLPSATPTEEAPTETAEPLLTPTSSAPLAVVRVSRGIIYEAPATTSTELNIAPEGSQLVVSAVTADGLWYEVTFLDRTGWILAQQVDTFSVSGVDVFESPTPTSTATNTPTESPSPTLTATPTQTATATLTETPTLTFTPSETATNTPTETATPRPTSNIATVVACVLTVQSGEVNIQSLPSAGGDSAVVVQVFGGDTLTASAQSPDGWFLTEQGWIFGAENIVRQSSATACGALPVVNPAVTLDEVAAGETILCDVLTADVSLYESPTFASTQLTALPPNQTLSVYQVAQGADGGTWYRTAFTNAAGITFEGWLISDGAGPVAGSCPSPNADAVTLFGNANVNPLGLTDEPDYAESFDSNAGLWNVFPGAGGTLAVRDGRLSLTLQPREVSTVLSEADAFSDFISDAYISMDIQAPPNAADIYIFEILLRGYYTLRFDEAGTLALAEDGNPSRVFGSTAGGTIDPIAGFTLGIHLNGETIAIYVDGREVLAVSDGSSLEGLPVPLLRASNRSTDLTATFILDDIAIWNLAE